MRRPTLIIMVKEPHPGRVKTRLGREIGHTAAAWWYRHHTRHLLRRLRDARWQTVLAVAPDREGLRSRVWPSHIERSPQGKGDLGHRMGRILKQTSGPSVLIGSDIPAIERFHIAQAFRLLGACPSVIGPAPDGGFWLVGLSHPRIAPADLFQGVRWSHPTTLQDTLPTLPQPVARAATLNDVDEASDLQAISQQGADNT